MTVIFVFRVCTCGTAGKESVQIKPRKKKITTNAGSWGWDQGFEIKTAGIYCLESLPQPR